MSSVSEAFRESLVRDVVSDRLSVLPPPTEKDLAVLKKALLEYGVHDRRVSEIFAEEVRAAQARHLHHPPK